MKLKNTKNKTLVRNFNFSITTDICFGKKEEKLTCTKVVKSEDTDNLKSSIKEEIA